MKSKLHAIHSASFRDPAGFIFTKDNTLYRQVNKRYQAIYEHLMQSGLYAKLTEEQLLIPHSEVSLDLALTDDAAYVLRPEPIAFISYPYEWSFSQLKVAALTTLKIQRMALAHGMILKDASAYNIQFHEEGRGILIDTLSFDIYAEGSIWEGYRQFCQHFLAPLALLSYTDIRLGQLFRTFIDGIPLDLASKLLPRRAYLSLSLFLHVFTHAGVQRRYQKREISTNANTKKMSRKSLDGLIDNLEQGVRKLKWSPEKTPWADYYNEHSYADESFKQKTDLIETFIKDIQPDTVWDLGANTGHFSRLASQQGIQTIAWDIDPGAVEINFKEVWHKKESNLLPLILDLTNPSPAIGWANNERQAFIDRGPVDLIMALALVHHLAIGNNVPLNHIANFLANLTTYVIIEFVPKVDPMVQTLLSSRQDIFDHYTLDEFIQSFGEYFDIQKQVQLADSNRVLFLLKKK